MLLHQLGEHFVFPAQFVFKLLDALFLNTLLTAGIANKRGCSVLEKLFLPAVENRWLELILVAKVGYGNMINQMALEDEYLLFRGVIVTFLSHGLPSVRDGLS